MHLTRRTVSAVVTLAVAASLAVAPAVLLPASATKAPTGEARSTVTPACAAARYGLANAQSRKAAAHRALVKARKALRKAKRSHRAKRIKHAKKVLTTARHRYAARSNDVRTQTARANYVCSAPTSATRADATGQKTQLLVLSTGQATVALDLTQLTALLDRLLPGASGALTPGQLTALLTGFNTGPMSLDGATAVLGGTFSPAELQSLLDGTAGPALVLELAQNIIGELSGLTGGAVPVPSSFDPTALLQTIAGVFGSLDPSQLGNLLALMMAATGHSGSTLDSTQLTTLLDGLIPGLSSLLDPTQLTAMLTALNTGGLDASTLSNLLGGQFDATELQQVISGGAGTTLVGEVLANVIAQLGTVGGGDLALPGTVDPGVLSSLVTSITSLVGDVLTSTPIGGAVCTLLPIFC